MIAPTHRAVAPLWLARPKRPRAQRRAGTSAPARDTTPSAPAAATPRIPPHVKLLLAAAAVVVLLFLLRVETSAVRSYDEYYHVAIAREMRSDFRIESFRWTPFSLLYDRFADGAPLFHLLLMPLATLPLETATLLAALLGQVFVVGSFAWLLWRLRVPRPWWFVLALPALGSLLLQRFEAARPQVWLIGFCFLVLAALAERRWRLLFVLSALFGLTHVAGWLAIAFAAAWTLAGVVTGDETGGRRLPWQPVAAALGGWLVGQLVHPNVPNNFHLLFMSNLVIPFQAAAGGDAALRAQLGNELMPPSRALLAEQYPAFIPIAAAVYGLLRHRAVRSRETLVATLFGAAFLFAGAFFIRRFFELGAPLGLAALALVAARWAAAELPLPAPGTLKPLAVGALAVSLLFTVGTARRYDAGKWSPPREMAKWLGEHGQPGERVFTAQWADSGPLFYSAPQLESLVALDPTVFYAKDPRRFATYATIAEGRHPQPVETIREQFGARWITVWKAPRYRPLGAQLLRSPGATLVHDDHDYVIFDLGPTPEGG